MKSLFEVNPNKPLHKNHSFWLAICTPISTALILSIPIAIEAGPPCLTYECQKRFIEHFQLPIGILSLSVLFGVMVGRFHGSAQRVASYNQAQENNTFRNFYDHRKFFAEWLTSLHAVQIQELEYIKLESPTRLYGRLFSNNSPIHISTQLSKDVAKSAFDDIVANIHTCISRFHTTHLVKEEEPDWVISPEYTISVLNQTVRDCNSSLKSFGVILHPIEEWPHPKYRYDFERILNEIALIFMLAAEFSVNGNPQRLSLPQYAAEQAKSDYMQGYLSLALSFGVHTKPEKS